MTRGKGRGTSRPGVVAGMVLRAARLSAQVTEESLARVSGVSQDTIQAWEEGSAPLASVPLPEVENLQATLRKAGANPHVVADFVAAAWCDLYIGALADDEDISCLLADPISHDVAFGELMLWALGGHVPPRYQPYAEPGPLLTDTTMTERLISSSHWLA